MLPAKLPANDGEFHCIFAKEGQRLESMSSLETNEPT